MSTTFKTALQQVKIDGALQKVAVITSMDSVGQEFNEDGTVKKSLTEVLAEFTTELAEKAKSTEVTTEISEACENLYNRIMGLANSETTINEAYDTLKEVADWIGTHGDVAATLTNDVAGLKTSVNSLVEQVGAIKQTTVEASETNGYIHVNGQEVKVYENPGKNVFVATTEDEVTVAETKMAEGDLLLRILE